MIFKSKITDLVTEGVLSYNIDDYAFNFRPSVAYDAFVRINYLELYFNLENKKLLCVDGFHAYHDWHTTKNTPPNFHNGDVIVQMEIDSSPFGVYDITDVNNYWSTYFNPQTNWVCIGEPAIQKNCDAIQFATDTVVVLVNDQIKALWLHPEGLAEEFENRKIVINE